MARKKMTLGKVGDKLKVKERGARFQISERMGACASEVLILPLAISL